MYECRNTILNFNLSDSEVRVSEQLFISKCALNVFPIFVLLLADDYHNRKLNFSIFGSHLCKFILVCCFVLCASFREKLTISQ